LRDALISNLWLVSNDKKQLLFLISTSQSHLQSDSICTYTIFYTMSLAYCFASCLVSSRTPQLTVQQACQVTGIEWVMPAIQRLPCYFPVGINSANRTVQAELVEAIKQCSGYHPCEVKYTGSNPVKLNIRKNIQ